MVELLRCKSCGYVVEADRVGDVCPACGVPRAMMEVWKDPVSTRRRSLLALDIHPIIDHFSVSFAACALALSLFVLFFPEFIEPAAGDVMRVFAGFLPLAVIASFLSGLYDGKLRFRRTTTPILRRKKATGLLFLGFAVAAAVVALGFELSETWVRAASVALEAAGVGCAYLLGRAGKDLLSAMFPG